MKKNLSKTLFILILIGFMFFEVSNILLEKKLEQSIRNEYAESGKIKVSASIWSKNIGNLAKLHINIIDWQMENYAIKNFEMSVQNVKINWQELFKNGVIVVEHIETGWMNMILDERAINYYFANSYKGLKTEIKNDKLLINYQLNIWGKKIDTVIWGTLKPYQKKVILFQPQKIEVNNYVLSGELEDKIIKKIKIKVILENIPFDFNLTTVKIMQDKVFIEGIV